jgi:signal transduction histidine kinase
VTVCWRPASVELQITNDGAATSPKNERSSGRGLIGMRERAMLVGGELEAGHLEGGSYRVRALLPLEPSP